MKPGPPARYRGGVVIWAAGWGFPLKAAFGFDDR